jgi:hypothetical protein
MRMAGEESGASWSEVLASLVRRKMSTPVLAIIDGNPGLHAALEKQWPSIAIQRCTGYDAKLPLDHVLSQGTDNWLVSVQGPHVSLLVGIRGIAYVRVSQRATSQAVEVFPDRLAGGRSISLQRRQPFQGLVIGQALGRRLSQVRRSLA